MFRVEYGDNGREFRVIDDDRGVTLEEIGIISLDGDHALILTWGHREIPLIRFPSTSVAHPTTGRLAGVWAAGNFNHSHHTRDFKMQYGPRRDYVVPSYTFKNNEEKEQAFAFAIEGLLLHTFRQGYAPWADDRGGILGAWGRVWWLSDFGYAVQPREIDGLNDKKRGRVRRLLHNAMSVFRFGGQRKRAGASMFRFDPERYAHEGVIDEERGVTLRIARWIAYSTESAALLTWGDREIPFSIDFRNPVDPRTNRKYTQYWFVSFGVSAEVRRRFGAGEYKFRDEDEKAQALFLAIEAFLVAYFNYWPTPWDASRCAVLVDGREWRLSDFPGYPIAEGAS